MTTNPGNGYRYNPEAGPYLSIDSSSGIITPLPNRVMSKESSIDDQAHLYTFDDSTVTTSMGITIGPDATIHAQGVYQSDMVVAGTWHASPLSRASMEHSTQWPTHYCSPTQTQSH